jgi:signal transduction histidine kinase
MRKVFAFRLFIQIFLITILIIGINRLTVQFLIPVQIEDEIVQEIAQFMGKCANALPNDDAFHACIRMDGDDSLLKSFSSKYIFCHQANRTPESPLCSAAKIYQSDFSTLAQLQDQGAKVEPIKIDSQEFFMTGVVNVRGEKSAVLFPLEAADAISKMLFRYRDKNYILVLPVVIFSVLLMAIYLTYIVLKPIKLIERSIAELDLKNFKYANPLISPYKEFDSIVDSFEKLKANLEVSFQKARRFASDASHELRTPLTILRGNAEALMNEFPIGSKEQIRISMVTSEIDRLINITQKLLWLSRADANKLSPSFQDTNLSDLLNQWVLDAKIFNPDLKILSEIASKVMWRCDPDLVQQLISNLYDNAVKYNIAQGWIRIRLTHDAGYFHFSIENTSHALPVNFEKQAFDRFYRGDDARSRNIDGLGLGLSLCQEISLVHAVKLQLVLTDEGNVILELTNDPNAMS